jgi:hypothetical protein
VGPIAEWSLPYPAALFSVKSVIKNKTPGEEAGTIRLRKEILCRQCGGPGGVVLASCSTAAVIRPQVTYSWIQKILSHTRGCGKLPLATGSPVIGQRRVAAQLVVGCAGRGWQKFLRSAVPL